MPLKINQLPAYAGATVTGTGSLPARAARFVIDSRKVEKGVVFVAIKGENRDGHDFLTPSLIEKTELVIVNRSWYETKKPKAGRFLVVDDTVVAMLKIAEAHLKALSIPVVAVTGSNGKTTTRAFCVAVLRKKFKVFETPGNFNNHIGLPLSVFQITSKHDIAVLEMGTNHFGEIKELVRYVHPETVVITNIGHSHLEFLKSRNGVLRAKMEILTGMKKGTLIVNGDDDLLAAYKTPAGIKKCSVGFSSGTYLRGRSLQVGLIAGTSFKVGTTKVVSPIPGSGAAIDALLALAVGKRYGIAVADAAQGIKKATVPGERMKVEKINGAFMVADCYNSNPDSVRNAITLIGSEKVKGRKVAVLGTMGELGSTSKQLHRSMGELVAKMGFSVLLTLGEMGKEIGVGAKKAGLVNAFSFDSAEELSRVVKSSMKSGDIVLIKGSHSLRMETIAQALSGVHA